MIKFIRKLVVPEVRVDKKVLEVVPEVKPFKQKRSRKNAKL
jgi:hypothetical protein